MERMNIVTTEDLKKFKDGLLGEFKALIGEHALPRTKTWLRSADVTERFGISPGTLQDLRNRGIIPSYKVEGILFYDAEEIDRAILEHRVQPMDGTV